MIPFDEHARKRGVPSPDEADAVALTFSEPDGSAFVRDKDFHRSLIEKYAGAMSEVHEVIVTIKPPKGSYPGQMSALCQKQTQAVQQKSAYSITSSARARSVAGTW